MQTKACDLINVLFMATVLNLTMLTENPQCRQGSGTGLPAVRQHMHAKIYAHAQTNRHSVTWFVRHKSPLPELQICFLLRGPMRVINWLVCLCEGNIVLQWLALYDFARAEHYIEGLLLSSLRETKSLGCMKTISIQQAQLSCSSNARLAENCVLCTNLMRWSTQSQRDK